MSNAGIISFLDEATGLYIPVTATNPLPVTGGGGGGGASATATAANPVYVEGATVDLSVTLFGAQRSLILDAAGAAVDWTAPVPVTQSGAWAVDATQVGSPWGIQGNSTANDGASAGNAIRAMAYGYLYNGANQDRARAIAASFGSATGVQASEIAGSPFTRLSGAGGTTVKSGAGILHKIIVNTPLSGAVITMYDNTSAAGTIIGTITLGAALEPITLSYDLGFSTGLHVVTSAATDITVVYR